MKSQNAIKGAVLPQLPMELAIAEIKISEEGDLTVSTKADYNGKVSVSEKKKNSEKITEEVKPVEKKAEIEIKSEVENPQEKMTEEKTAKSEVLASEPEEIFEEKTKETNSSEDAALFEKVKDDWSDIVADVRKSNGSLVACLKTCQPIMAEGGEILVACQYSFYKTKLQKPENRVAVEQVASETVEAQVRLKFITKEEAAERGFEMEEIHVEEKQAEDLINSALDMFGGEVVA
jgi:hypothetical protein